MISKKNQFKNEIVDYVFNSEKNFFDDWINENEFEDWKDFVQSCENNMYVKAYLVRYGQYETTKMLKEKFDDIGIDHQLICEL